MTTPRHPSRHRILVIDDNKSIHDDIRKILEGSNTDAIDQLEADILGEEHVGDDGDADTFLIDSAFQGDEGHRMVRTALVERDPYVMAFVDVRMPPGWDGVKTISRLWQEDPVLQVVLCTAYTDYSWREIVKRLGRSDKLLILKKPFDAVEVLQVAHALACKWYLHQQVRRRVGDLEAMVNRRTRDLTDVNQQLKQEIAEREMVEGKLRHLATHDSLTDLPNRLLLTERISLSLRRAARHNRFVSLLLLDLDHFKEVNDLLGHRSGDHLLQLVSARLKKLARECDTVARMGGDEFVVVLDDLTDPAQSEAVAARIIAALGEPFVVDDRELRITTSIGISTFPIDCEDLETLIKSADMAMYQAKEQGRNTFAVYAAWISSRAMERATLKEHLAVAIERQQLKVVYQPLLDLDAGAVSGMEALLRWEHPDLGMLSPLRFIALAEESGLIIPIGEWVIQQACVQNKAWQDAGHPQFPVTVNLSARQLQQHDLTGFIAGVLEETGLDPHHLILELTESAVMRDFEHSRDMLVRLHDRGVRIIIDDFGSGYSSFGRLKKLPIHALKIDRFFVQNIVDDERDAAIVKAIIALAHSLQVQVIAEGVETLPQLERLRDLRWESTTDLRCDKVQGFLFSKPVKAAEATRLLEEGSWTEPSK